MIWNGPFAKENEWCIEITVGARIHNISGKTPLEAVINAVKDLNEQLNAEKWPGHEYNYFCDPVNWTNIPVVEDHGRIARCDGKICPLFCFAACYVHCDVCDRKIECSTYPVHKLYHEHQRTLETNHREYS